MKLDTLAVHVADPVGAGEQPLSPPVWLTSEYFYDDVAEYSDAIAGRCGDAYVRGAGPTASMLHRALALLEGAEAAWAFPGGMAAIRAAIAPYARKGAHIIAPNTLYGGTYELLQELADHGVRVTYTAPNGRSVAAELHRETTMILLEGLANPTITVADLQGIGDVVSGTSVRVVVDNSLATPVLLRPLEFISNAIVVHSTTKYISGHSDVVGGAVCGSAADIDSARDVYFRSGAHTSAFDVFLTLRGMQTLVLRVRQQSATACMIANALRAHPAVLRVWYPGLDNSPEHALARAVLPPGLYGPMLSFELAGGFAAAVRFSRRLKITRVISSFGGTRTALCHPGSTSHCQLDHAERARAGITEGMLRLAVGLEDAEDLMNDLLTAIDG